LSRVALEFVMLINSLVAQPALLLIGTVWPAYATYKTVVDPETEEMTRWLMYWLVYAIFTTFEWLLDIVGAWVPLYFEMKIAFFLWLTMDKFKGASILCKKHLQPLLDYKRMGAIDEQIDMLTTYAKNFKVEDISTFVNWVSSKDVRSVVVDSLSAAATKKVTASAPKEPEQSSDKPQEPDEVMTEAAEVVEAEDKKGK